MRSFINHAKAASAPVPTVPYTVAFKHIRRRYIVFPLILSLLFPVLVVGYVVATNVGFRDRESFFASILFLCFWAFSAWYLPRVLLALLLGQTHGDRIAEAINFFAEEGYEPDEVRKIRRMAEIDLNHAAGNKSLIDAFWPIVLGVGAAIYNLPGTSSVPGWAFFLIIAVVTIPAVGQLFHAERVNADLVLVQAATFELPLDS